MRRRYMGWFIALIWTALTLGLMLAPSAATSAESSEAPLLLTSLVDQLSRAFGSSEVTDAIGHLLLFGFMTTLWLGFLLTYSPSRRTLVITIFASLMVAAMAEFAQALVVYRGPSLLDLTANWLGVIISTIGVLIWTKRPRRHTPLSVD